MQKKIIIGVFLLSSISFSYTPSSTREINKIKNEKVEVFREKFEDAKTNRNLISIKFDFKNGDYYEKVQIKDKNSSLRLETIKIKRKVYKFRVYGFNNGYILGKIVGYEDKKQNVLYKHWRTSNDSIGYESKIDKEMTPKYYYTNGLLEAFQIDPHKEKNDKEITWAEFDDYSYDYRKKYQKLMSELENRNKNINLEKLEEDVLKKPNLVKLKAEMNAQN